MTENRPSDWPSDRPSGRPGDWRGVLRAKGYRLTPQRELVLRAVEHLGHATPDEVLKQVHTESEAVNLSTVYRNLELLEELGLVRHAHLTDRAPTYHSTSQPQHVHLVCRGCQRVVDAEPDEFDGLAGALRERHGFTPDIGHLTVFGTCGECAAEAEPL
ncbi:MAG: Fur family transcriptional regulator [Nocardioidaceae bacterium]